MKINKILRYSLGMIYIDLFCILRYKYSIKLYSFSRFFIFEYISNLKHIHVKRKARG